MPIEMSYVIKCDVDLCGNAKVDGPYDIGFDYFFPTTLPRAIIDDWVVVDYKLVCPKHKIKIFKGYAHGKKKEYSFTTQACREGRHPACANPSCTCHCHMRTKPRDSL